MIDWLNKNAASPWLRFVRTHGGWIIVAVTVLFVFGVRWRLREMPLERDEGEYAYAGQLMLEGIPPYKAVYSQKLPGTPAAYAAIMTAFGQNASAIHVGVALINVASVIMVFLLGRRLLDDVAGAAAAVSFALLTLNPWVLGLAGHATHFVVVAALAGMLLLLRACDAGSGGLDQELSANKFVPAILRHSFPLFFASGILFGLAFLMKQHGIFFGIFGGVYLLWIRAGDWVTGRLVEVPLRSGGSRASANDRQRALIPSRRGRLRPDLRSPGRLKGEIWHVARDAGIFAAGFLLPYALTCLILAGAGAFHQFIFWTVSYARKYSSAIPLVNGSDVMRAGVTAVVGPNLVLWILPWVGALMMWWETRLDEGSRKLEASSRRRVDESSDWAVASTPAPGFHAQPPEDEAGDSHERSAQSAWTVRHSGIRYPRFFLTMLLFCSVASVSIGFYFRAHYFILLMPVLALLTGVAVSRGVYLLKHDRTVELFLALPILGLFVIAIGAALIGNGSTWLAMTPKQAMTSVYGSTLFSETATAAEYLKANAPKDALVAVLGSEPEIYFYSRRQAATGYIYTYPLMEQHEYALKMQEEMIGEIERAHPLYLVYVDDDYSWLPRPESNRRIFDWWKDYWATDLDLVKTIEFQEDMERGADAESPMSRGMVRSKTHGQATSGHILILKRRK